MTDLIAFLKARLDEDEAIAKEAAGVAEAIRLWLAGKVRFNEQHKDHWRDCPGVQVFDYWSDTGALSDVTADPVTSFTVIWGCPHSDERRTSYVRELGTLPEIIAELQGPRGGAMSDLFHHLGHDLHRRRAVRERLVSPPRTP